MPGKVSKRGFRKLPNSEEVAVLVDDDSGSEIELLDMTDLKNHRNGGLNIVHDGGGRSCCSWFVPLYMVLLTFLLVLLTVFQLYVAYNVQLLRSDVSDITKQVGQLEDDLSNLELTTQEMNETHSRDLAAFTKFLQKKLGNIDSDMEKIRKRLLALETVQKQQIVDQVKKFNKSLSVVYSFAQEVEDIHQSIAGLDSTVSSLDKQVKEVKKSVGDALASSGQMSGVVQNVQDTLTVLQGQVTTHEKAISAKLAGIHYELGNMTREMESMDWMDQASLTSFINMVIANSSNLSTSSYPSETWLTNLTNMEGKVGELQIEADCLATNLTLLQESVSSLESIVLPLTEHIHNFYNVTNRKKLGFRVKNATTPIVNDDSISTDTQSVTSSNDKHTPEVMNSPRSLESTRITTNAPIPSPTSASSLVQATHNGSATYSKDTTTTTNAKPTISTTEMGTSTRLAPLRTSLPSANEGDGTVVAHSNRTDLEQDEDSNQGAIKFVQDLLGEFSDLDWNLDGFLSPQEFSQFYGSDDNVFSLLDSDHSGELTEEELRGAINGIQKLSKENGGVDSDWLDDQHKSGKIDSPSNHENGEDSKNKDNSFNWLDYV